MSLLYILLGILLLGILIMIHELGHFWAARICGIAVKEFAIGFGPAIVSWRSKKYDTLFAIRPIPLGGYCLFYGDTEDDPKGNMSKDDPRNYNNAPVWKRMISVIAGPLMNLVLAFVVSIALMGFYGVMPTNPYIAQVQPNTPAYEAKLQEGDVFVRIEDQDLANKTGNEVSLAIGKKQDGTPIDIVVNRAGEDISVSVTPKFDEQAQRYLIGVTIQQGYEDMTADQIIPMAWKTCVEASSTILRALGQLFTTGEGLDQTTGPVGVVQLVAEQTKQGGLEIYLYLMVIISINLGLVNLLPIPALDGSRLIFMIIEAIFRKPVSQRVESIVHMVGFAFLLSVMIYFTFKDVLRIFG